MTSIQPTLQRWAELEPERCVLIDPLQWEYSIIVSSERGLVGEIRVSGIAPNCRELMLLEFAVREVAISKGRTILIRRNPDNTWRGMVDAGSEYDAEPAIALLKAYLQLLTWEENQPEEAIA